MKAFVYHVQINVNKSEDSFSFWREMLQYLGYEIVDSGEWGFGATNGTCDFWIMSTQGKYKKNQFHRKNTGLNHVAFGVSAKAEVDRFINEFLMPRKIKLLYDSPREYPEYEKGYYAVYFEDSDRIKIEVAYKNGFAQRLK